LRRTSSWLDDDADTQDMEPRRSDLGWTERADDDDARPRTAVAIVLAIVCACAGFAVAFAYALDAQGGPNGPGFDDRMVLHHNAGLLTASLFGGGIGWFIGAVIGWFLSRPTIDPGKARSWTLRAAALGVVLVGLAVRSAGSAAIEDAGVAAIQTMILAGAAIVSVTLVILAQRTRFRQTGALIGAIVAIAILTLAGMRFSSLLPLDRAWLNAWRSRQADAESFAPNLLIPAAHDCPGGLADGGWPYPKGPPGGLLNWAPYNPYWLDGHVPRWLPDGFGLLADRSWSTDKGAVTWGVWAGRGCRQVRLMLASANPHSVRWRDFPARDHVGDWAVAEASPSTCRGALVSEGRCLEYRAWAVEAHGNAERILVLQMLGIDRDVGDRIAEGIPI
jgi:hypothetical protein